MNLKNKIIAFDIDGTLARNNGIPSDFTCQSIATLIQKGYHICLVTGRQWVSSATIYQKCQMKEACVFCNGAYVYHPVKKKVIHEVKISKEDLFYFIENEQILNCIDDMMYEVDWDTYSFKGFPWNPKQIVGDFHQTLKKEPCALNVMAKTVNEQETIKKIVENYKHYRYRYWDRQGEIYNSTFSKAEGLQKLLTYYGKTATDLIFFGDASNDLSALSFAFCGVAMQNAPDEIKQIAKYVTDEDNEHDGAIKFLFKLIKEGEEENVLYSGK